ncbi:Breast cancer type 2 susceptibility protein [Galdieria sulphuraria]|nr:Breast cancer type 2 susceptibility protein [Galdieria sulphuraria]
MEEKIPCPSKQVEIITATFQQCYDPYYGIIQVQVPCTTKSELSVVNIDMEQVMGNALQSSVLVSACYLERVETKRGERDWLNGLEEMTLFNQQQFKAETFSAENKTVELLQNHIQDDSEDWQRSERIININEDSKRKEISDNKLFEMESLEERLNALSSFHKYEAKRFTDNVATPLFVTGGGKEVKTKDVSNEWAKSFLAEVVVPECDGNSRSSLSDLAKEEHMLQVNSSLQKQDADYERKQDVIFTTGKVLTNPKMELKRKLTNSVLKRARKALYDNRTPNKTMDNKHCTPGKRLLESQIPCLSSVVERRVKKHIPFHYICSSLAGQPVQPGYHIKKVSLKELLKRKLSENRCGIFSDDPELSTCLQDPVRFRFKDSRMNLDENFSISPEICYLKPDCHSTVGLEEFTEHLRLLFPDADGPLMKVGTNSWIRNAYRLLMWKLASLEVFFHPFLRNKLNALNLGIEFSKRLEREWNLGHRSILHKIVERDALVGSHYILFISDIFNENFIEVSDGWYCVRAKIDSLLCDAILKKKLFKGCKISVCSASFHHFDEENPENTVLSLHFNGVRRARWNCKLGPRRHPPVLHGMSSLRAMGGQIPCVEVVIERSFPVRFVESDLRDETKTRKVFRNEEDEERIVLRRNEDISIRLDEIFKKEEQASSEMTNPFVESERDVSRMTEILVVDRRGKRRAYVTFWRPTDNALEILRNEGYVIRLYGVIPSKRLFDSEILHMAVPSKMPIQVCSTKPLDTLWIPRYSLSVSAIASLFSGEEFDSCFVILLVGDLQYGRTRFIYLMQTIDGPVTAVKLFDEQAQNIPSVIKRATRSSKKIALVAVKNLKFICCDKRCGIYFCHHTSRCVWLSEQEAKKNVEFFYQFKDLQKLFDESYPNLMALRQQLLDFVNGKIRNLYQLRGAKMVRVWEILNASS